jgi:hypothetical protein
VSLDTVSLQKVLCARPQFGLASGAPCLGPLPPSPPPSESSKIPLCASDCCCFCLSVRFCVQLFPLSVPRYMSGPSPGPSATRGVTLAMMMMMMMM